MQLHGHTPHHKPLHLQANKSSTTTSTCTIFVTKLWLLVKIVKQLAGTIKALWHKSPALWSMGFVPSGRHTAAFGYKSHTTRNPWCNYNLTLYSLQCTPQHNTHKPILLFTTSTHNHSKTTNRELWCVWLERSM